MSNLTIFCRQVRSRSSEHASAILLLFQARHLGQVVSILRQELDSMIRTIYLLSIQDRVERTRLIDASVSHGLSMERRQELQIKKWQSMQVSFKVGQLRYTNSVVLSFIFLRFTITATETHFVACRKKKSKRFFNTCETIMEGQAKAIHLFLIFAGTSPLCSIRFPAI